MGGLQEDRQIMLRSNEDEAFITAAEKGSLAMLQQLIQCCNTDELQDMLVSKNTCRALHAAAAREDMSILTEIVRHMTPETRCALQGSESWPVIMRVEGAVDTADCSMPPLHASGPGSLFHDASQNCTGTSGQERGVSMVITKEQSETASIYGLTF